MTYPLAAGALISIMDQIPRVDDAVDVVEATRGWGRPRPPGIYPAHGPFRRFLRRFIHFFSYHLILARQSSRVTRARRLSPHRTPDGVSSALFPQQRVLCRLHQPP